MSAPAGAPGAGGAMSAREHELVLDEWLVGLERRFALRFSLYDEERSRTCSPAPSAPGSVTRWRTRSSACSSRWPSSVLVWQSARSVGLRLLDGVEPDTLEAVRQAAAKAPGVESVTDVRVRWIGHRLQAEVSVTVPGGLTVSDGHSVAREVEHRLLHRVANLDGVTVHVDPSGEEGESHHRTDHQHDGLPPHAH